MRNILRIFLDDVRFAKSNVISILVVLGLCLVPVMYAWFNIAGSWNPYGNTSQLKVAVANSDKGHESDLMPVRVNIGDRVVNALHDNDEYGWVFVSESKAIEGVRSGEFYAAVVIPSDFSEKLMTVLSTDVEQATIDYYLNMKENPIAPILAGEGEAELLEDIRVKFTEAVDEMTIGLASDLVSFIDGDNTDNFGVKLVSRLDSVADDLDAAAAQVRSFVSIVDATSSLTEGSAKALSASGDTTKASKEYFDEISGDLDLAVSSARDAAARIESQVNAAKSELGIDGVGDADAAKLASDVGSLAASVQSIERNADSLAKSLDDTVESLTGSTDSLTKDLSFTRDMLGTAANRLGASASKIRKFRDDVSHAVAAGNLNQVAGILGGNSNNLAQWLAAPVKVEKHAVYPVENYGSSMAPFYTILSIWVGAVVLVAIMKTTVSEERVRRYAQRCGRPVRNYELYLGRYLVFAVLSLLQATVVCLGDLFFLGIQCVHPLLFLAACWICALVFCNIVYTFAVSFGEIGKALCIILLVMQVAGSGGEYPIQMMGDFFQAVYPYLPFTHGIRAMQASIAGVYGAEYVENIVRVLAFLLPSLFLGLVIRRPVIRFMNFFNAKLEETGLM